MFSSDNVPSWPYIFLSRFCTTRERAEVISMYINEPPCHNVNSSVFVVFVGNGAEKEDLRVLLGEPG